MCAGASALFGGSVVLRQRIGRARLRVSRRLCARVRAQSRAVAPVRPSAGGVVFRVARGEQTAVSLRRPAAVAFAWTRAASGGFSVRVVRWRRRSARRVVARAFERSVCRGFGYAVVAGVRLGSRGCFESLAHKGVFFFLCLGFWPPHPKEGTATSDV